MQTFARILDAVVDNVIQLDGSPTFGEPEQSLWREIPEGVEIRIGWIVAGEGFTPRPLPEEPQGPTVIPANPSVPDLDALRLDLLRAVDARAETERLRWITPGTGQAMTYARKVEEAKAILAGTAFAKDCPMLSASLGIDGDTIEAVARVVLDMDAQWARIGGAIEARRLTLKRAVMEASDAEGLAAIDTSAGWRAGAN